MDYISVSQAAAKWDISERRVHKLCEDNRIKGLVRFGHIWMILKEAAKPVDARKARKSKGGGGDAI